MFAAYTLKHSNIEGFAADYVLCNVKADIAYVANGDVVINNFILFIVDNKTGNVYDTISCDAQLAELNGVIESEEDVALLLLNSGVLFFGISDENFWDHREQRTCFLGDDLAEFQQVLDAVLAE